MESPPLHPSSSFFLPSPPRLPSVHGINCVHFNYDLISEERWGGSTGGCSTGMAVCVRGCVSGGHDLRTGCYWVSVVPPRPWPLLSSNSPPPPEDPQVHMHTKTHTHTHLKPPVRHASLTHPVLPTVHLYPSLFFPVFSNVSSLCFFFSPSSATCPTMASGVSAGVLTPLLGSRFQLRLKSEGTPTVASSRRSSEQCPLQQQCLTSTFQHFL